MTTLEKLGTIAMGYVLLCGAVSYGETPLISHGMMFFGSILLLAGDNIEGWLRKRFPDVGW